jgi:hypothetical protein
VVIRGIFLAKAANEGLIMKLCPQDDFIEQLTSRPQLN